MSLPHTFFIGRGGAPFEYPANVYTFSIDSNVQFENFARTTNRDGTTLAQAQAGLLGAAHHTSWRTNTARFNVPINGYQDWLIPVSGVWEIFANGAKGGDHSGTGNNGNGGRGGRVQARFKLAAGSAIRIICGSKGFSTTSQGSAGGGGGTFVLYGSNLSAPISGKQFFYSSGTSAQKLSQVLVVAGGGGGAGFNNTSEGYRHGTDAYAGSESLGGTGRGNISQGTALGQVPAGGTFGFGINGNGGTPYTLADGDIGAWSGGAGAGILTAGTASRDSGLNKGTPPEHYSSPSRFRGGDATGATYTGSNHGGFGGGGSGSWAGAGGGGFSGGEADYDAGSGSTASGGGGGGNYINTSFSIASEGASYVSQSRNTADWNNYGNCHIKLISNLYGI